MTTFRPVFGATARQRPKLYFVFLGLTITSSWGNGHATTYRSLVRALYQRGHSVLFLECDKPWYRAARDIAQAPWADIRLYESLDDLHDRFACVIREADVVVLGSYVPEGVAVGHLIQRLARGITAFYDIDTPVTLSALDEERCTYLSPELVPGFDLYLSFTGGPTLRYLERRFGARAARVLYCSADPDLCHPKPEAKTQWDLSYLGTYSPDRQPTVEDLVFGPAHAWRSGRFVVAGPQYPATIKWPTNCERIEHLAPDSHRSFYNASRFTVNATRSEMVRLGFSPSVRLFEAAACGTAIISDPWHGLETLFRPGEEILIARSPADVLTHLREMPEERRLSVAARARKRVLASHTGTHRAAELESYVREVAAKGLRLRSVVPQ